MENPRPGTDAAADIDRAALTRLVERFRRQHALRRNLDQIDATMRRLVEKVSSSKASEYAPDA